MQKEQIEQACLDLSKAALDIFEMIQEDGIDAPMEGVPQILRLKAMVENHEIIRGYYARANIMRMMALGVSPETLLRMGERT